jgi:hypothetical protein
MITYRQARAHAQQCGVDVSAYKAVPISINPDKNPRHAFLSEPVLNPENLAVIYPACCLLTRNMMVWLATAYGVDYVICYN